MLCCVTGLWGAKLISLGPAMTAEDAPQTLDQRAWYTRRCCRIRICWAIAGPGIPSRREVEAVTLFWNGFHCATARRRLVDFLVIADQKTKAHIYNDRISACRGKSMENFNI